MIEASSAGRHRFPARLLHWAVALVLPIQFLLGWLSEGVPGQQAGFFLLRLHYQLGMLLVLLMVLRLAWCLARGTRGVRVGASAWHRRLVVCVHGALYALMFLCRSAATSYGCGCRRQWTCSDGLTCRACSLRRRMTKPVEPWRGTCTLAVVGS